MLIIKLNATDSTNDYLKQLHKEKALDNYTVVTTYEQTKGKGQMGAKWHSEPGKNLTFSILHRSVKQPQNSIFDVNVTVAVSILQVYSTLDIPKLSIKWPNDIMAENKKLGGILIENILKSDGTVHSIIGIGLNVNQEMFPEITHASSLKALTNKDYNLDQMLGQLVNQLKHNLKQVNTQKEHYWKLYHEQLFKLNTPIAFENQDNQKFMGIIKAVSSEGKLQVQLEDDSLQSFGIKEVKMLY